MKRIACRHCREPFGIPAGFIGDARCPNCSRSTPWPPEEPRPELPPPASGWPESPKPVRSRSLPLVLPAAIVTAGIAFAFVGWNRDSLIDIAAGGFLVLLGIVFQLAAYQRKVSGPPD